MRISPFTPIDRYQKFDLRGLLWTIVFYVISYAGMWFWGNRLVVAVSDSLKLRKQSETEADGGNLLVRNLRGWMAAQVGSGECWRYPPQSLQRCAFRLILFISTFMLSSHLDISLTRSRFRPITWCTLLIVMTDKSLLIAQHTTRYANRRSTLRLPPFSREPYMPMLMSPAGEPSKYSREGMNRIPASTTWGRYEAHQKPNRSGSRWHSRNDRWSILPALSDRNDGCLIYLNIPPHKSAPAQRTICTALSQNLGQLFHNHIAHTQRTILVFARCS